MKTIPRAPFVCAEQSAIHRCTETFVETKRKEKKRKEKNNLLEQTVHMLGMFKNAVMLLARLPGLCSLFFTALLSLEQLIVVS